MHVLDVILGIIAAVLVFNGIRRGLIGEIVRLTAMIAGCIVAFLYYQEAASMVPLRHLAVPSPVRNGIAFFLIYLLCLLAVIAAGWVVRKAVHLTPLAWVDRLTGGAIGLSKALLIAYVACISISSLPARQIRNDFSRSAVYKAYTRLPKAFSLRSLLRFRTDLRQLVAATDRPELDSLHQKFDKFKAAVDSVKSMP